jgi:hypothetical protein
MPNTKKDYINLTNIANNIKWQLYALEEKHI